MYLRPVNLPLETFYVELIWPVIPDSLCDELIAYAKSSSNIWEGKGSVYSEFEQYDAPDKLKNWVRNNLAFIPSDYAIRLQAVPGSTELRGHVDALRASSYNFVLTEDGGNTNWHDEDGNVMHTVKYKSRAWYQHQSQVAHSVDAIASPRIAVTIFKFEVQPWYIKLNPSVLNSVG